MPKQKQEEQMPVQTPPNMEEQLARRQSAPYQTAEQAAQQAMQAKQEQIQPMSAGGVASHTEGAMATVYMPKVTKETLHKANATLLKYKQGKSFLERRIVGNEQWYKLRHWEAMRNEEQRKRMHDGVRDVEPTSGWLFNSLANKHADAMDNFPEPSILPREEGDKDEAKMLSDIIPVILDQAEFEQTYSDVWEYKLKTGTGVYGVFWDPSKLNGLGDIDVRKVDLLNIFWEPGITDIQKSRNLYHVELVENDVLIERYPQLEGKLGGEDGKVAKYVYDDSVDTSTKSALVDLYYKRHQGGRDVLHYIKYVNDEVLFATENDPEYAERGWYDHGLYPVVFDPLYTMEGTPAGFGYIDIAKSTQEYIDRANRAIMQNMLANVKPRHFVRNDGAVNEAEYADLEKDFVHVDGNLGDDSIRSIAGTGLSSIYLEVMNAKIDELKEVTGNRDVATGGTTGGVTAASGIAAMQEASSKLSRDNSKASYRAYRKMILMIIELIRQFYDLPRCFRIMGEAGAMQFVQYSNANIKPQDQGMEMGVYMGNRVPYFDVQVSAAKQTPYSKMSQNELALQFYNAGFFNPQLSDQALACLEMMDFDRKDFIMQRIAQNGTMFQQLMMMQQALQMMAPQVDAAYGTNYAAMMGMGQPDPAGGGEDGQKQASQIAHGSQALGGDGKGGESSITAKAKERVAESTAPR